MISPALRVKRSASIEAGGGKSSSDSGACRSKESACRSEEDVSPCFSRTDFISIPPTHLLINAIELNRCAGSAEGPPSERIWVVQAQPLRQENPMAAMSPLRRRMIEDMNIDSKRMVIRIAHGKGGKERYAMLSAQLLWILRGYWRLARPHPWLFPGRDPSHPIDQQVLHAAC